MEADTIAALDLEPAATGRFFRRLDWSAFWTACIVSLVVYVWSLPPTVTLEDSGELAVAGDYLGVPHPPGYPIWTLCAWVFTKVFSFMTFRGQPNPAWAIALMSAVFGALAAGTTAMLICRSGSDILRESAHAAHAEDRRMEDLICWVSGVVCSLMFAFSPVMWSQSVIVEVYSLNAFFLVLIFLLVYMWLRRPSDPTLFATAFIFGLGLTNYQVLLLAALALVLAVMVKDLALLRDFVIAGIPFLVVLVLIFKMDMLPGIQHPLHWTCAMYMSLNFLMLMLVYFFLPRGKTVAISLFLMELGIAFYAYEPIVSDLRNPPMNWGYPRTWEGFKHAITRGQYEKIKPSDIFSANFIHQVGAYLEDLRGQFTLLAAPLGFLPFTVWQIKFRGKRYNALYGAIALSIAAVAIAMLERFLPVGDTMFGTVYKLLFCGVLLMLAIGGLVLLLGLGTNFFLIMTGRKKADLSERVLSGLILFGAATLFILLLVLVGGNLGAVTAPLRMAKEITGDRLSSIFWQSGGIILFVAGTPLLAGAVLWLMRSRFELRMTIAEESQKWVVSTLIGFIMLSLLLISLANLKLDIQDMFIQRVKFISSHGLYAFWIGYGMIFSLALVDHTFKGHKAVRMLTLGAALMLPIIPLNENRANSELIRRYGGAEQTGHDFGWQFGNYQLRGAEAINEELSPTEEPLPNPEYPLEMTQDAIFYGGTDPGRFVPTYMIYSARVREDVYLITQNALADNTYMSVMRDLYGDSIWIPAQPDSARAFQVYVAEVKSGKRPKNAQLTIEGGRVQVSGALGVMEINGILAEMIFDHNNHRHGFYVEESYVIRWMYPYLSPHGLIMKINRDKGKNHLTASVVREDTDFWDWYTRRLTNSTKFQRDVVARKSFSKLRSAIGGLYSAGRRAAEAENAFQQARLLYALSPEANFRLVQEVLMPQRRLEEAKELMEEFNRQDPGNSKVPDFLRHVDKLIELDGRMETFEKKMGNQQLDLGQALELAAIYQQAGQLTKLLGLSSSLLKNTDLPPIAAYRIAETLSRANQHKQAAEALDRCVDKLPANTPPEAYLNMAHIYHQAKNLAGMQKALDVYLRKKPSDWKAWFDMASLQLGLSKKDDAIRSLEQAIRLGGDQAIAVLQKDGRFSAYAQEAVNRAQQRVSLPSLPNMGRP